MKIKIGTDYYTDFIDINYTSKIDSVASTLNFTSFFDSSNSAHKKAFNPLAFNRVEMYSDNNKLLFTGIIIGIDFTTNANGSIVSCSCYSLPGVLNDCSIGIKEFPLESNQRSLKDIIEKLITPFGVKLSPPASPIVNTKINKTTAEVGESVEAYLSKLSLQKGLILSHNAKGELSFVDLKASNRVKYFLDDTEGLEISVRVNGQQMHSEITTVKQPSKKQGGGTITSTINNSLIKSYRPFVKKISANDDGNVTESKESILQKELEAITVTIKLKAWFEELIVGDFIELLSPSNFIYKKAKLAVKSFIISRDSKGETMQIDLVLPESLILNTAQNAINIFDN